MTKKTHPELVKEFKAAFKEAGRRIHQERVVNKVPLLLAMNSLIEAAYETLSGGVLSRLILGGQAAPSQQGLSPSEKILRREMIAYEILKIIAADMEEIDTKHEYSVGFAKRERKGSKK